MFEETHDSQSPADGKQQPDAPAPKDGPEPKPEPVKYDPKSFGAGIKKAEFEYKQKVAELEARLKEREIQEMSIEHMRLKFKEIDSERTQYKNLAEKLAGTMAGNLEKRAEPLPAKQKAAVRQAIESGNFELAESILEAVEPAPKVRSAHGALVVEKGATIIPESELKAADSNPAKLRALYEKYGTAEVYAARKAYSGTK